MTLFDAIEYAAKELPDNWTIHLHTENGSAWVELEAPDFTTYEPRYPDDSFDEQIRQLVAVAQAKSLKG